MCAHDPVDVRAEIIDGEEMIDSLPSCLSGWSFPASTNVSASLSPREKKHSPRPHLSSHEHLSSHVPNLKHSIPQVSFRLRPFFTACEIQQSRHLRASRNERHNNLEPFVIACLIEMRLREKAISCKLSDLNSTTVNLDGSNTRKGNGRE